MSERITHDDMLQRVAAARGGWQVPGAYLVQAHDDAMPLNRIADELVAERNDLRAQLAAAEAALALATNTTPGKGTGVWVPLDKWQELHAQLAATNTEAAEQAWEIAKLRYYTESLERLLTPEQRQAAATEAQAALALHNPPEWCKVTAAT